MAEEVVVAGRVLPALPTDDEIKRIFRLAEAFYQAGIYKDVKQAQQAFAKIVIGRDLGLSVAQSMQAIQFVQGSIQLHYATLALVIRSRGFTWEVIERSSTRAAAKFFDPDGAYRDEVEFTMEDAVRAGLTNPTRSGEPSMYEKYPRNMLWGRMMADAVRFSIPEATGGIPVFTPGEIPESRQLTEADWESEPVALPPEVEAVIARAESLGDPSNTIRDVWIHHRDRGPEVLAAKVAEANAELDALERQETITDAVVEPDVPIDTEGLPDPPAVGEPLAPEPEEPKLDREQLRKDLEAAQKKRPRTEDGRLQLQAEIECLEEDLAKAAKQAADEDPGQGTLEI